ncbi:MAG TPA: DUF948 domain-containing protein [Fulvivirga sp.]|nr:DUF948 domain-containing protein [Fulvivirga sp.]
MDFLIQLIIAVIFLIVLIYLVINISSIAKSNREILQELKKQGKPLTDIENKAKAYDEKYGKN